MKSFFIRYWKSILVVFAILYLCIIRVPHIKGLPNIQNFDKIAHLFMYIALTAVLFYDFTKNKKQLPISQLIFVVILFPIVYGGIIEIVQGAFFPARTASWADFAFDAMGALGSFTVMCFWYKKKTTKR